MPRAEKQYYVYLLTNYTNSVIYTGVTNDLLRRVDEHRRQEKAGFSAKYNVWKLVYFETAGDAITAIEREKQIKGGPRSKKMSLVQASNPTWRDLWHEILG